MNMPFFRGKAKVVLCTDNLYRSTRKNVLREGGSSSGSSSSSSSGILLQEADQQLRETDGVYPVLSNSLVRNNFIMKV
jgi:hypothetical protein